MNAANDFHPQTLAAFRSAALSQLESVHRFAFHLCRDTSLAEDLVQETYLRAFRAADTFDPQRGRIRPWLFRILNNVLREMRRRNPLVTFDSDVVDDEASTPASDVLAGATTLDHIDWEQVEDSLKRAIDELPAEARMAFLMFAVEGLKYREISYSLGVPIGTVMSRIARARMLLIRSLTPEKSGFSA